MNSIRIGATVLLILGSLSVAREASAQGRGTPATKQRDEIVGSAAVRATKLADLDAWLRRLTGRFHVAAAKGSVANQLLEDCISIGEGPGVDCVLGSGPVGQKEIKAPTMILFGIDPVAEAIRYLLVNDQSIAEDALGKLEGDTVNFHGQCPNPPNVPAARSMNLTCSSTVRIRAAPNTNYILIQNVREQRVLRRTPHGMDTEVQRIVSDTRLERMPRGPT